MHTFDYRFLKEVAMDPAILNRISNIERARGSSPGMSKGSEEVASAMESRAMVMSVMDSNAIEGIRTSEERIVGIVSGGTAPMGHDELEIAGYRDALRFIHRNHGSMVLDMGTILELYGMLMAHTGIEDPGFKRRDNIIVSRGPDGTMTGVSRTVPASETEESMASMLAAYWEVRDDPDVHSLLLIPCFIMDFLRIHPFPDGNGRMSRLLTTLLLYQEGYDVCRYVSMESKINAGKADYYRALEESQVGWFEGDCDYTPFIRYILGQLLMCYRDLNRIMGMELGRRRKSGSLEMFLRICGIPVSKRDLCTMFPELSEVTVSRTLARLCGEGVLEKVGGSRSTRYAPRR